MNIKHTYQKIPYYKPNKNLRQQVSNSSRQKKISPWRLLVKKMKNYVLASLAYNCPVSSWRVALHRWRGVNIGKNVLIGLRVTLDNSFPEYIYIEDDVSLAGDNYILAHSNPYEHFKDKLDSYVAPVVIKRGAWVTIKVTVLPGVTVGENAIIGAGVVLHKDVSPGAIVTLNKNRIVEPETTIKKARPLTRPLDDMTERKG
jgi:acetyltransferase-like isoleucine patch superfamily enzyme